MPQKVYSIRFPYRGLDSIEHLARTLDVSIDKLLELSVDYDGRYQERKLPKKDGVSFRTLNVPCDQLKHIQRRINSRIFRLVKLPHYLFGGIKDENQRGTDYIAAANHHVGAQVLSDIDVKSFFPTICENHVRPIYAAIFRCSSEVNDLLIGLTLLNDELPQGAPTSVAIAHMVFFEKEPNLVENLERKNFRYSRFIDDIIISSKHAGADISYAFGRTKTMIRSLGFETHPTKTHPKITAFAGLNAFRFLVSSDPIRVKKKYARKVRSDIRKLETHAKIANYRKHQNFKKDWNRVSGQLTILQRLNHPKHQSYRRRLSRIMPLAPDNELGRLSRTVSYLEGQASNIQSPEGWKKALARLVHRTSILRRTHPSAAYSLLARIRNLADD